MLVPAGDIVSIFLEAPRHIETICLVTGDMEAQFSRQGSPSAVYIPCKLRVSFPAPFHRIRIFHTFSGRRPLKYPQKRLEAEN